jgi:hypothetical protein
MKNYIVKRPNFPHAVKHTASKFSVDSSGALHLFRFNDEASTVYSSSEWLEISQIAEECNNSNQSFLNALEEHLKLIVSMRGIVEVSRNDTKYVIEGSCFTIVSSILNTKLWIGKNGPRLFFIANVISSEEDAIRDFRFCFGGAAKVGWEFNYEPIDLNGNLSIWGTCLANNKNIAGNSEENDLFWIVDIAMMAQSFVRTCERLNIKSPSNINPAPL